jgi:hypothetical protein
VFFVNQHGGWTKVEDKAGKWSMATAMKLRMEMRNGKIAAGEKPGVIVMSETEFGPNDKVWVLEDIERHVFSTRQADSTLLAAATFYCSERDALEAIPYAGAGMWSAEGHKFGDVEGPVTAFRKSPAYRAPVMEFVAPLAASPTDSVPQAPDTLDGQSLPSGPDAAE